MLGRPRAWATVGMGPMAARCGDGDRGGTWRGGGPGGARGGAAWAGRGGWVLVVWSVCSIDIEFHLVTPGCLKSRWVVLACGLGCDASLGHRCVRPGTCGYVAWKATHICSRTLQVFMCFCLAAQPDWVHMHGPGSLSVTMGLWTSSCDLGVSSFAAWAMEWACESYLSVRGWASYMRSCLATG
jgi:hypothetical protein